MNNKSDYWGMVERNIGMLDEERQCTLRNACIPIFGVGGLGGVAAEILVRSGVGHLRIVDIDEFEKSNLNRQVYCFHSTLGHNKVDVAEQFLCDINPELKIEKYNITNDETIAKMLDGANVALMCIDQVIPSIHVARRCYEENITMVETIGMPYLNPRVYNAETITFEQFHGFETDKMPMERIYAMEENERRELGERFINAYAGIENIMDFYDPKALEKMKDGHFTSFAPLIWMQGASIALEAIKVMLNWGEISYVPEYSLHDPFRHKTLKPVNLSMTAQSHS